MWSAISLAGAAIVLRAVKNWHQSSSMSVQRYHVSMSHRFVELLQVDNDITDDVTRDEICRKFIWKFLNGTTDTNDECEAFMDAFKTADCKDETQTFPFLRDDNHSRIDDDYHNWECCQSISEYYEKNCQETHLDAVRLLAVVSVLVVCGFMRSVILMMGVPWIPNAGVCILVGAVTGGLMRLTLGHVVRDRFAFDNDLFLQILLPPIIFQASICIDKRAFRRDLFPILSFAIFGTGLSAAAIGFITYYLSKWSMGPSLPLLDSLLFGALMSSIDPVATLSILVSVGVSQTDTLFTLIFGESLLNDGVSIVLFDSLVRHMGDTDVVDVATLHDTLKDFIFVTSGSFLVGVMSGAMATLYFWLLQGKQTAVAEVGLFFMWALVPYYIADGVGLSGIISIMVMGFMMDYFVVGGHQTEEGERMEYMQLRHSSDEAPPLEPAMEQFKDAMTRAFSGRGHIHSKSRKHVHFFSEVVATLMETAIFAYLGLFLFNEQGDFILMMSGIIACVTSRAGMVICLSLVVNACVWFDVEGHIGRCWRYVTASRDSGTFYDFANSSTKVYLDKRTQLILFSAGVRGAVSYALVQNIPVYNSVTKIGSHFKGELRAMTSATIVVLLFSFGAMTYYTIRRDWPSSQNRPTRETLTNHLLHTDTSLSSEVGTYEISQDRSALLEMETPVAGSLNGSYVPGSIS
jgi:NhaP-type Na+/H+ or K+/H+ antiporter